MNTRFTGVPFMVRIMISKSNPDVEISRDGETWTIATKSLMRTAMKVFKLNEEFEEQMPGATLKVYMPKQSIVYI